MVSSAVPPRGRLLGWLTILMIQSLCIALIVCTTYVQTKNTLYHNGRWISSKTRLGHYVMGAVSYMVTRVGLQQNRLNLGAWHGFQEILYYQPKSLARVRFDCLIPAATYVSFVFDKDERGFSGVRLSNDPRFPSMFFTAAASEEFLTRSPLPTGAMRRGWNHVDLEFREGKIWTVLNGASSGSWDAPSHPLPGSFGFKGCLHDCAVDNVTVQTVGSSEVIRESFDNFRDLPPLLVPALVRIALLNGLGIILLGVAVRQPNAGPLLVTCNCWIVAACLLMLGLEWFFYAPRYPRTIDFTQFPEYKNFVEAPPSRDDIIREVRETYSPRPQGKRRILFIGTSQTWGAGVNRPEETWVRGIESRLNDKLKASGPFECINCGVSGSNSEELLATYRREWIDLRPERVVINLAFNDATPAGLAGNVSAMVKMNEARGICSLIVLEPSCIEYREPKLLIKRDALREVAREHHVAAVDMQSYLDAHHDDGFLWWDFVHLSTFGQKLFADRLFQVLAGELAPQS